MILNSKKIFVICLIFILVLSNISILPAYAIDFTKAENFIENGKKNQGITDLNEIGNNFSEIGKILVFIGAGVLVGGLGYIGIMYMVSSPEKRAKLKQQLIGLLVAAIVIFGAYSIWSILITILAGAIDHT